MSLTILSSLVYKRKLVYSVSKFIQHISKVTEITSIVCFIKITNVKLIGEFISKV